MKFIKEPKPDPSLEPFQDGLARITKNGKQVGYIATVLSKFWSPFSPLSRHWWVWSVIIWSDGSKERRIEDYAPWSYVNEMKNGQLEWDNTIYEVEWVPSNEVARLRKELNIQPEDF